jgi:hydroxyacylglutathione hydrolase
MKIIPMQLGPIETNCYIVFDETTKDAMVIDPAWDYPAIDRALSKYELKLRLIYLTHGHADHIGALQELREKKLVPVYIGEKDSFLIQNSANNLSLFMGKTIECTSAEYNVKEGDTITVGPMQFKVLETPGHTPGGTCLYGDGVVFSGDTLFQYSIGRTDFSGGSYETLLDSIEQKLMTLPDDTVVAPGHGPTTTIGTERRCNPYVGGRG